MAVCGQESYNLVGGDKAVNQIHYLLSTLLVSQSPLGGDREGCSYLRKSDNPQDPQSRDPHCSATRTDSTVTPPHTPSHFSLLLNVETFKLIQIYFIFCRCHHFDGENHSVLFVKEMYSMSYNTNKLMNMVMKMVTVFFMANDNFFKYFYMIYAW